MAIYLGGTIINKKLLGVNKLNKIMLGVTEVFPNFGAAVAFTPADLFTDGSKGCWYDLTDLSTLFQDAAGTIPVTAAGQPIGKVLDKSGNNNHLTQTNNAKRPLYGTSGPYARMIFDGLTSAFKTAAFALGSDKVAVFAGYANDKTTGTGTMVEFSANYMNNGGSFAALVPSLSTSRGSFGSNGGSGGGEKELPTAPAGGYNPRVLTMYNDLATDGDFGCDYIRVNSQPVTGLIGAGNTNVGAGPYGTHSLFVGARNETANYMGGYIYQLVVVGKVITDEERTKTEQFIYARIPTPAITVVGEFPAMTVGTPITPFTFTAFGGTSPYTFTEIGGMPHGLTLASNGQVSGTPTIEGAYNTIIEAVDALGFTGDRLYTGTVAPAAIDINIIGDFPTNMTTGVPIAPFSFTADGGTGPYTFSVVEDAMPAGLTLASNGEVSGTPTVHGPYSVVIDATDALANNGYKLFEGHVLEATGWTPYDLFGTEDKGAWYDFDDDMDTKLAFRRNQSNYSEGDSTQTGGSNISTAAVSIAGFDNSIYFADNTASRVLGFYTNPSWDYTLNLTYTITFYVEMDDGSVPQVGFGATDDFVTWVYGTPSLEPTFELVSGTVYKGTMVITPTQQGATYIEKTTGNSTKGFKITGRQFELGSVATAYQKVTDWNTEFMAQYPQHALFQDSAGTIPVTNIEQPVGLVLDKSGRGNHLVQATAAKRPLYQSSGGLHWLKYDGVDDNGNSSGINISQPDVMFVGMMLGNVSEQKILLDGSTTRQMIEFNRGGNSGKLELFAGAEVGNQNLSIYTPSVVSAMFNGAGSYTRLNAVQGANISAGANGLNGLVIGSSGSGAFFYAGNVNQYVLLNRTPTAQEITDTEQFIAAKAGIIL